MWENGEQVLADNCIRGEMWIEKGGMKHCMKHEHGKGWCKGGEWE